MMLCATIVAYLILIPQDFAAYSRSIVALSLFVPNFLFWKETGYFDHAAELKPLLHTWSLGIEEQFYAIFPIAFYLIHKWDRRYLIPFFMLLASLSLLLAEQLVLGKPAASFFLLPTRIWEFLCGGLIAMLARRDRILPPSKFGAEVLMVLGMALIGFAVFTFDRSMPVPSAYLLIPLAGTMLILMFGEQETIVGSLLKSHLFVFLGLTSYSTYLWHQPILALVRYQSLATPGPMLIASSLVATVLIGYLSWRFIESPIRRNHYTPKYKVFVVAFCVCSVFAAFGSFGHLKKGFELHYTAGFDTRQQRVWNSFMSNDVPTDECRFSLSDVNLDTLRFHDCRQRHGAAIVILGDSHAEDFYNAFLINSKAPFVLAVTKGGCRPHTPLPECDFEGIKHFISDNISDLKTIFYIQSGMDFLLDKHNVPALPDFFSRNRNQSYSINAERVELVINYLESLEADGKTVWLGPRFEPRLNANKLLKQALACENKIFESASVGNIAIFAQLDQTLARYVQKHKSLFYISALDVLQFDASNDLYTCNEAFWSDGNHWTIAGEREFGRRIIESLRVKKILMD
jgi:peptidoglycan/LPS O-acetylase OafA/YrhL